jgi:hypothetical protein
MTLEISKGFPTDSEFPIAEINHRHDGVRDIPAEVRRQNGELWITIFGRTGGPAWEYPLNEWIEALQTAAAVLDEN